MNSIVKRTLHSVLFIVKRTLLHLYFNSIITINKNIGSLYIGQECENESYYSGIFKVNLLI